ncbi:hypothetical protein ASPSYDRAFT_586470 [Aspergillus sydowii CBS 593.65]|uniref:Uncharacterized protein n=1 Tax=Aspergillus sydowii CBS 593.65 TaxID=1036612 RepID=A0A1L9TQT5_9EURO|nr:uncharacterized protein ASPSYDRAFT_586470 [Aspergillus sydowii CBS 593.65]OJJ61787.1 hypothetical protein ASPSYDRAFT_586470 [Aspergillus sydowii CBS 593.65]
MLVKEHRDGQMSGLLATCHCLLFFLHVVGLGLDIVAVLLKDRKARLCSRLGLLGLFRRLCCTL